MKYLIFCCSSVLVLFVSCRQNRTTEPEASLLPSAIVHTRGGDITQSSQLVVLDRLLRERVVVDSVGINNFPKWSPDRKRIVFQGNRNRPTDIYLVNADGSNERNLSNDPDFDEHPIWSPDGSRILFRGYRGGEIDLYIVDTSGQNLRDITPFNLRDDEPCWSSDGSRIAYVGAREGNQEIYVTDPMGLNHENITNSPNENEFAPSWSPDGSTIAYTLNGHLYTILFPGGMRRQLTLQPDSVLNSQPQWSPDGNFILYQTNINAIYRVKRDGSSAMMLTSDPATPGIADHSPRWSPDGSSIAFTSYRTGQVQIFLMNRDGGNVQQLTFSANGNAVPEWAPQ